MGWTDFNAAILKWYHEKGRDLPWRASRDPYAIWLSEIILQQTRIEQGRDYWLRFMRRWPRVELLAEASEDEVLREWQGLGYYSRARNLHAAARQIVTLGHFPDTYESIRQLRGVGDYTAAAIASLAFGLPYAAVDGNVYRVLSRYFGIDTPIDSGAGKKLFAALARQQLVEDRAADYNSAMMDFGAMQCTPQSPRCADCPLSEGCSACRDHRVADLPVKARRTVPRIRRMIYVYIRLDGHLTAIRKRRGNDIWRGLWELVQAEDLKPWPPDHESGKSSCRLVCHDLRHMLTHQTILADCFLLETRERPALPPSYLWVEESDLGQYALPKLVEKLLGHLPPTFPYTP